MSEQTYRRNGFVIGDRSLAPGSGLAATWSGTTSGDAVGDPEATSTARLDRHGRARREGDRALRPDPDAAAGGVADDQARGRAIPAASPTPGPEARLRLLAVQDDALGHGEHLVGAADPASADPAPEAARAPDELGPNQPPRVLQLADFGRQQAHVGQVGVDRVEAIATGGSAAVRVVPRAVGPGPAPDDVLENGRPAGARRGAPGP